MSRTRQGLSSDSDENSARIRWRKFGRCTSSPPQSSDTSGSCEDDKPPQAVKMGIFQFHLCRRNKRDLPDDGDLPVRAAEKKKRQPFHNSPQRKNDCTDSKKLNPGKSKPRFERRQPMPASMSGTALLARCLSGCVSVVFSRTNHVRHPQTEGPTLKACTREMCFIVVLFFRHTTHGTRKLIANT